MVGARAARGRHRALARRARVPPQRALVLADRHPAHARAGLRQRLARILRDHDRHARRAGTPPPARREVRLQPRTVRARDVRDGRRRAPRLGGRPRLRVDHVGHRADRDPGRRRADDPPDPRGDRPDRGPSLSRPGPPDVRYGPGGDDHRHRAGAGLRDPLGRAARGRAAAGDPDPDRVPRLPRLRPRAPGPREGQVPLRSEPHAVGVPGDRRRARRAAGTRARGLPRRAGRGHPLRRRRRRPAAHRPRAGQHPRGDGARRRRRGPGPARMCGELGTRRRAVRAVPGERRRVPRGARRPARHAGRPARRGPRDRHDHARQPLRPVTRLQRRRSRAVRDTGRQRERRAPVRPPRAGRLRTARPPGPASAPGPPRSAHGARQPLAVQPARARSARARARRSTSP